MRRAVIASAALVATTALGAGCTSQPAVQAPVTAAPESTVKVERRSLTSTVVLTGVIAPTPEYLIEAPRGGRFDAATDIFPGATITEGKPIGRVADQDVVVPAPGALTETLVAGGSPVAARVPVFAARYEGFGVLVDVPVVEQYRLYDGAVSGKVNITGGPSGLDCKLVTPRVSLPEGQGVSSLCLLPVDAAVVTGLQAKVGLNTGARTDVLTLPLQAVSGRAEHGEVTKISPTGDRQTVPVELGLSDGVYVEITAGLGVDDTVAAYPPGVG